MPAYAVYGLTLESNVALAGLPEAPRAAPRDIVVSLGDAPDWGGDPALATIRYRTPPADSWPDDNLVVFEFGEGFVFRYADETRFHVSRDGRAVWGTWAPSSTLADTMTYLLGPVLGFAQRLMGVLCLHASAVVVDGAAIALCGPAGAGKSTTAGAFAAAGFGVLSEDLTACRESGARMLAMPGYDHLRVWPESERILLGSSGELPRLTPTWDKRALTMRRHGWTFHDEAAPLAAVCLILPREAAPGAPRTEAVPAGEAFVEIAANTYANYLLDDRMRRDEFAGIARLMSAVRVFRAAAHEDPARIGALVDAIVAAARA